MNHKCKPYSIVGRFYNPIINIMVNICVIIICIISFIFWLIKIAVPKIHHVFNFRLRHINFIIFKLFQKRNYFSTNNIIFQITMFISNPKSISLIYFCNVCNYIIKITHNHTSYKFPMCHCSIDINIQSKKLNHIIHKEIYLYSYIHKYLLFHLYLYDML